MKKKPEPLLGLRKFVFTVLAVAAVILILPVPPASAGDKAPDFSPDEKMLGGLRSAAGRELEGMLDAIPTEDALEYAVLLAAEAGNRGDGERMLFLLRWGRGRAARAGLVLEEARFLRMEGLTLIHTGDPEESALLISRAAELYLKAGHVDSFASDLILAGNIRHGYGALLRAVRDFERVISEADRISDPLLLASALTEGAMVRYKAGLIDEVPAMLERALPLFTEADRKNEIGTIHKIYGNYYVGTGRPEEALKSYEKAREYFTETGNAHEYANTSYNIGLVLGETGGLAAGVVYLINAVENFMNADSLSGAGMAATELARMFMRLGDFQEADRFIRQAIEHLRAERSYRRLAMAVMVLGELEEHRGNIDSALSSYREAVAIFERLELSREAESVRRIIRETERKLYDVKEM